MDNLAGRKALVTGASRGIGAAIALRLAADGADVAITYQSSPDAAEAVVAEIRSWGRHAVAIAADSGNPAAVQASVDKAARELGGLDILVNNVGVPRGGPLESMSLEDIDLLLNLNVRSAVLASRAAIPHLIAGGRIINLGSSMAVRPGQPGVSVYALTKGALVAFTKGLARDLGPRGMTVNIVHPGHTDTAINPADGPYSEGQRGQIPTGRYNDPKEVATAVAFLASPAAAQINGAELAIDGGLNA